MPSQERDWVRSQVTELPTTGAHVKPAAIRSVSGSESTTQDLSQELLEKALSDIVESTLQRIVNEVTDATATRRRSVTDVLLLGLTAVWVNITTRPQDHHALRVLQLRRPDLQVAGPAGPTALAALPRLWVTRWLMVVSRRQDVSWDRPVMELAGILIATIHGLVTDRLDRTPHPDDPDVDPLLRVVAFQLAEHSTRNPRIRYRPDR